MTDVPPPLPAPDPRRLLWIRIGGLAVVPVGLWALAYAIPLPNVPLCIFRLWTGRPCPGCGMTRSIVALVRGDLFTSLRFHPLGVALAALFVATFAGTAAGIFRGDDPVMRFLDRRGWILLVALAAAFLGLWVVRAFVVPEWAPDGVCPPSLFPPLPWR